MPLHIAAMQQGKEAETVVTALLNAYPEGAKHKDNVCALLNPQSRSALRAVDTLLLPPLRTACAAPDPPPRPHRRLRTPPLQCLHACITSTTHGCL